MGMAGQLQGSAISASGQEFRYILFRGCCVSPSDRLDTVEKICLATAENRTTFVGCTARRMVTAFADSTNELEFLLAFPNSYTCCWN